MESGHSLFFDPSCLGGGNMVLLGSVDSVFRGSRSVMMNMNETLKKRPFFTLPDEHFDDEYYDDSSEKKRRLTVEQVHMLEKSFETENKLEPERKNQLAKKLGLQPRQVAVWFQNRRARWKTKQLERDFDQLKSSYDSLLFDYEAVRKETDKLKTEVVSLTKKLQPKEDVLVPLEPTPDPLAMDQSRLSSGSTGLMDEVDGPLQKLGESDHSSTYFPNHDVAYTDGDRGLSGEDDGSDDGGHIYCYDAYVAASDHHEEEEEEEGYSFGWWVWS